VQVRDLFIRITDFAHFNAELVVVGTDFYLSGASMLGDKSGQLSVLAKSLKSQPY
jgi:hypothetical protein